MATGVLPVAHSMGLGVPEDVSVVGFDDSPLASQVWPALNTIRQPICDMAAEAAELLLRTLRGEPADRPSRCNRLCGYLCSNLLHDCFDGFARHCAPYERQVFHPALPEVEWTL